jgi:NAD-dependent dihydropyrimidine dehydrogenase PreA subunit
MGIDICYFSGSGNSLFAAKVLAEKLHATLVPISLYLGQEKVGLGSSSLVVAFPEHHGFSGGIPPVIMRFIKSIAKLESLRVYAVATYTLSAGSLMENFAKLLAASGGTLTGGFVIKMPHSDTIAPKRIVKSPKEQRELIEDCRKKCDMIAEYIQSGSDGKRESVGFPPIIIKLLKLFFRKQEAGHGASRDNRFYVADACDGCGTCSELCPVGDIEMKDGKPSWKGKCEECCACLQWCPKEAIHIDGAAIGNRYHNPEVSVSDMINRAANHEFEQKKAPY